MSSQPGFSDKVAFIWSLAELLRGDVKAHECGQFVLPFLALRRMECALEPTKDTVLEKAKAVEVGTASGDKILRNVAEVAPQLAWALPRLHCTSQDGGKRGQ